MRDKQPDRLAEWFETVRFRKMLFGGVDEQDVWKKLETLQALYRELEAEQRAAYEARLSERDARIRALEAKHEQTH